MRRSASPPGKDVAGKRGKAAALGGRTRPRRKARRPWPPKPSPRSGEQFERDSRAARGADGTPSGGSPGVRPRTGQPTLQPAAARAWVIARPPRCAHGALDGAGDLPALRVRAHSDPDGRARSSSRPFVLAELALYYGRHTSPPAARASRPTAISAGPFLSLSWLFRAET